MTVNVVPQMVISQAAKPEAEGAAPAMTESLAAELAALRVGKGEEVTSEMEANAKAELVAIHPSVRAAICRKLPKGIWASLNTVEKLGLIKMKQESLEEYRNQVADRRMDDPFINKKQEVGPNGEKLCPMTGKPITEEQKCPWTLMFEEMQKEEEGGERPAPAPVPTYTGEEVAAHNQATDAWFSFYGRVYDLTPWVNHHPGGPAAITRWLGKDATELGANLGKQHTGSELRVELELEKFFIGNVKGGPADVPGGGKASGKGGECCVQ